MENKGIFMIIMLGWVFIILIVVLAVACRETNIPISDVNSTCTQETIIVESTETTQETTQELESTVSTESIEPTETQPIIESQPQPETQPNLIIDNFEEVWKESAIYMAKTIWGEARGCSREEQAKVAWCILNRVDHSHFPNTIKEVVTSGAFHGYSKNFPCEEEFYKLSLEIILMWQQEKTGMVVNRTLEPNMYYMSAKSDGSGHNFREKWN